MSNENLPLVTNHCVNPSPFLSNKSSNHNTLTSTQHTQDTCETNVPTTQTKVQQSLVQNQQNKKEMPRRGIQDQKTATMVGGGGDEGTATPTVGLSGQTVVLKEAAETPTQREQTKVQQSLVQDIHKEAATAKTSKQPKEEEVQQSLAQSKSKEAATAKTFNRMPALNSSPLNKKEETNGGRVGGGAHTSKCTVRLKEVETSKQPKEEEVQRSGQDEQEGKELTQSVVQGEQKEAAEVAVEEEVETCTQSVVHDEQNNSTSCCCYATLQQSLELQGSVHDEQQRNTLQQSLAQDEQKEATDEEQESSHSFAQSIFANAPFKMVTSPITNYNRIDMAACAVCIAVPLDNAMVLQLRNDRGQILVSGFEVYAE